MIVHDSTTAASSHVGFIPAVLPADGAKVSSSSWLQLRDEDYLPLHSAVSKPADIWSQESTTNSTEERTIPEPFSSGKFYPSGHFDFSPASAGSGQPDWALLSGVLIYPPGNGISMVSRPSVVILRLVSDASAPPSSLQYCYLTYRAASFISHTSVSRLLPSEVAVLTSLLTISHCGRRISLLRPTGENHIIKERLFWEIKEDIERLWANSDGITFDFAVNFLSLTTFCILRNKYLSTLCAVVFEG